MEFIGLIEVGIVVIGAVYSAKCCPRIFLTLQKSPVQVMSIDHCISVVSSQYLHEDNNSYSVQ